jgi:hypothetical protein
MGSKKLVASLPIGVITDDNQICFISRCDRNSADSLLNSLRLSVRPSERMEQLDHRRTDIKEIWHWRFYWHISI